MICMTQNEKKMCFLAELSITNVILNLGGGGIIGGGGEGRGYVKNRRCRYDSTKWKEKKRNRVTGAEADE